MVDEPERRAEIHESLTPLFDAMGVTTNPMPVKAALRLLGHRVGGVRLPMVDCDESELGVIREALERLGLPEAATR